MSYTEWKPWIISTAYTLETLKNNGYSIGPCQDSTGTNALSIVFQCFKCVSWFLNGAIVGRWTYFWIWTYYQGLTVYTFRGISRHFWKWGPINFNFLWGPCTPCPKAMGVRWCHPRKIVKICMRNGAFFLHSEFSPPEAPLLFHFQGKNAKKCAYLKGVFAKFRWRILDIYVSERTEFTKIHLKPLFVVGFW